MILTVYPTQSLQGSLSLPGDKSLSHRAALFAALAEGESVIENFLVAGVTQSLLEALSALGVEWELCDDRLTVRGRGLKGLRAALQPLDCGNSATTIRMLAGALAAAGVPAILDGSPGLRRRPMARIVDPLQSMGVPIEASPDGTAPLRLRARSAGQKLTGLDYTMPVASAQVKTCLLLAALAADSPSTLREPEPTRDHSERMLRAMGVEVINSGSEVTLLPPHPARLKPLHIKLPGDISSASFLIVTALVTPDSQVTLEGVLLNPARTGLLDALRVMGAQITVTELRQQGGEPVGDVTVMSSALQGAEIDASLAVRMIDEFPAFAVAAAYASGRSEVRGAAELRHKESDRISALCGELRRLGATIEESPDGFVIQGGQGLNGGMVGSWNDHRLAMALAVAGLAARQPVAIHEAGIISESFPNFIETLQTLGANLVVRT
jgi:3-phosphoshikimate 1-carboxyvinyltransferase